MEKYLDKHLIDEILRSIGLESIEEDLKKSKQEE
ncbi:hypothetical protein SYNTR_1151 [Candidatus Syntrophocurvum alkaliphilum]|uniref:Uncharacterized protein n=1 Tax=Candidatus Syntrophocurvum alkaliphilum TaxID=2293317 RepID=A0A6I6DIR8_9FIRM|nr:hypothetical protein SYNTR_1151 [Candidatus Syntrophocurvum alkaliphilum]